MTLNTALLDNVMEHIEKLALLAPESRGEAWKQTTWRELYQLPVTSGQTSGQPMCGTAMCFAGWATELSGVQYLVNTPDQTDAHVQLASYVRYDEAVLGGMHPSEITTVMWRGSPVRVVEIRLAAQHLLGLTDDQEDLFDPENNLDDLRALVAGIKSGLSGVALLATLQPGDAALNDD